MTDHKEKSKDLDMEGASQKPSERLVVCVECGGEFFVTIDGNRELDEEEKVCNKCEAKDMSTALDRADGPEGGWPRNTDMDGL